MTDGLPRLTVARLAAAAGLTLLTSPASGERLLTGAYAADRMSDIISHADGDRLILTNLDGGQLLRAARLMEAPALCMVEGATVRPEILEEAEGAGVALLVSPYGLFETCGMVWAAFCGITALPDDGAVARGGTAP